MKTKAAKLWNCLIVAINIPLICIFAAWVSFVCWLSADAFKVMTETILDVVNYAVDQYRVKKDGRKAQPS